MTSKERMMCALERGKPDPLAVSVHQWQPYHLEKYLGGIGDVEAFERFGVDAQIQYFADMGQFWVVNADFSKTCTNEWQDQTQIIEDDLDDRIVHHTIVTPDGRLGIEEMIVVNGCEASETLAAPSTGANQEPREFKEKTGNRLALIGGMDQFNVVTEATQQQVRHKVFELFEKVGYEGGYICSMADHFFETLPEKLKIFVEAAGECTY